MDATTTETRDLSAADVEGLYRREGARLWQAVFVYSGNAEVASDAVAEAFAQLIRRGDAVHDPAAWVWRTTFAIARGELKRERTLVPLQDEQVAETEPSLLAACLKQLSPSQRAAIVLHYVVDLRLREIAHLMGTSKATVGVHLTRGRRRLTQLLEAQDEA